MSFILRGPGHQPPRHPEGPMGAPPTHPALSGLGPCEPPCSCAAQSEPGVNGSWWGRGQCWGRCHLSPCVQAADGGTALRAARAASGTRLYHPEAPVGLPGRQWRVGPGQCIWGRGRRTGASLAGGPGCPQARSAAHVPSPGGESTGNTCPGPHCRLSGHV